MTDADGHRIDAAMQFGAQCDDNMENYTFTEAQLVAFAKACERAGMAQANGVGSRVLVARRIADLDAELAPILEAERQRSLTASGYVPADVSEWGVS